MSGLLLKSAIIAISALVVSGCGPEPPPGEPSASSEAGPVRPVPLQLAPTGKVMGVPESMWKNVGICGTSNDFI